VSQCSRSALGTIEIKELVRRDGASKVKRRSGLGIDPLVRTDRLA
jgi:hypothetical protein